MKRPGLLLATLAVAYLAYHVFAVSGSFLSSVAVGVLLVHVIIEWSSALRAGKS